MSDVLPVRPPRHRGIYLLPNLVTTGAMFSGFYAIIASIGGRYTEAAVAVFIGTMFFAHSTQNTASVAGPVPFRTR